MQLITDEIITLYYYGYGSPQPIGGNPIIIKVLTTK